MSSQSPVERASAQGVSIAALVCFALLASIQLGWLPGLQLQWGFNLWAYLPLPLAACFGLAAFGLCFASLREGVAGTCERLASAFESAPRWAVDALVFVAAVVVLWLLRERHLYGDGYMLILYGKRDWSFVFPDVGASYLFHGGFLISKALGVKYFLVIQAWTVALGGLTALLLMRVGGLLGDGRYGSAIAALIASGGLLRIFAGHVEVYAFVIPALAGYLWAALAHLEGRCARWVPCLALGVAIWGHASCLLLVPSLLLLSRLAAPGAATNAWLRRAAGDLALAAAPSLAFLGLIVLGGQADLLLRELPKALEILGQSESNDAKRWWVRGWGGLPSVGTDVVFLSAPHLKYLANAGYLLAPAALPVVLALALRRPRSLTGDPATLLLLSVVAPLAVYACVLRPFWGPFDWDLFAITSLALAALAARLLVRELGTATLRNVLVVSIGFQLLFVGLPFLSINAVDARHAGPFATPNMFDPTIIEPFGEPNEVLAPWL